MVSSTILAAVLFATYLGIGALAHDSHFSLLWTLLSTILVWAGPAQIIVITTLGSGATIIQSALAAQGRTLAEATLDEMDELWNEAKAEEQSA